MIQQRRKKIATYRKFFILVLNRVLEAHLFKASYVCNTGHVLFLLGASTTTKLCTVSIAQVAPGA